MELGFMSWRAGLRQRPESSWDSVSGRSTQPRSPDESKRAVPGKIRRLKRRHAARMIERRDRDLSAGDSVEPLSFIPSFGQIDAQGNVLAAAEIDGILLAGFGQHFEGDFLGHSTLNQVTHRPHADEVKAVEKLGQQPELPA